MKLWKRIVALCLVACLSLGLFACKQTGGQNATGATTPGDGLQTCSVQVTTDGGTAMEGVGVYIYEDATKAELVWFAETDANGEISFQAPEAEGYVAFLENVPQGYTVQEHYPLVGIRTELVLESELLSGGLDGLSLKLGDVMYDLTVTDVQGNTHQISKLLEQKKAVVLNFWFLGCTPCRMEFPHLQEAYENYSADVAVLAVNPVDTGLEAIADYAEEMKLTMPVGTCDPAIEKALGIVGYPTTVVINQSGVISMIHTGSITSTKTFEDIFAHFSDEGYEGGVVNKVEDIATPDAGDEDEEVINNPTEIASAKSFKLTVKPGETVYCDLYRQLDIYMTINSKYAVLTMNGKTYKPKDGKIGVTVNSPDTYTPVAIGVTNTGEETQTFTVKLNAKSGSLDNPKKMKLGEFSVSIPAGKEEGIYYSYTAGGDGYLVVSCTSATKGVPYDYTLYNLNSYANRNLAADAELDAEGNTVVKVRVRKGQKIQFSCSALPDDNGQYPAIKMNFLAKLVSGTEDTTQEKKVAYAVSVTDQKGAPVSNVQVTFASEAASEAVSTDDKGNAALLLTPGDYTATIRVPGGYTGRTTSVALTEAQPYASLMLTAKQVTMKDYTVTVVDEAGAPVANVTVTVDGSFATTDANGKAVFNLPEGDYTAQITPPDGYTADVFSYSFDADGNATATVRPSTATEPGDNTAAYTVTVVDPANKPVSGVNVTFIQNGSPVAAGQTGSNGQVEKTLAKGSYTITLAFSSGSYKYDASQVTLTEDAPEATVQVIKQITEYTDEYWFGKTYFIHEGSQYASGMQSDVITYFSFIPTRDGFFEISTDSGKLMLLGSNSFFINTTTPGSSFTDAKFTEEVRQENLGGSLEYIIGVYGTESATLTVKRTGDIVLTDEEKADWIVWTGKQTPAAGTVYELKETGTLKYIDLAGDTAANTPVKGDDGLYHLGSKTGPVLYMVLGKTGFRYQLDIRTMMGLNPPVGGTQFNAVFYEGETFVKKETYNECMKAYCQAVDVSDGAKGVYPLTDDLIYMIKNVGQYKGWWDAESPSFTMSTVKGLNTEIAWMFNVCYFN